MHSHCCTCAVCAVVVPGVDGCVCVMRKRIACTGVELVCCVRTGLQNQPGSVCTAKGKCCLRTRVVVVCRVR